MEGISFATVEAIDKDQLKGLNSGKGNLGSEIDSSTNTSIFQREEFVMPSVEVPNVIGKSKSEAEALLTDAGLKIGNVTPGAHPNITAGNVTGSSPAVGTEVEKSSAVNLDVSSGPAQVPTGNAIQTGVPDVTGLTRMAAETALKGAGLTIGPVKNRSSDEVPYGGAVTTNPAPGTLVTPATPIELFLSRGSRFGFMSYLPTILFAVLGITVIWLIGYIITQEKQVFLKTLAEKEVARGLITFLIALATVGIAIILAISTLVLNEGPDGDKRFDRGKQVLSVLIGVLGTIVGFYFGSADSSTPKPPIEQGGVADPAPAGPATNAAADSLPSGTATNAYPTIKLDEKISTNGMKVPLKWTVTPMLPAGLQLDGAQGTIGGTPAAKSKGEYEFRVTDNSDTPVVRTGKLKLEIK
ncbi:PASTA domain-containing protein [Bradyrhizobium sp.]|uniref:PASTA domain-containing protein n=1 Tax=Bradyrhizobium sp. TaxID=376 RepID=UPI0027330931|nr:PASTA domain-containing protein [Bradyrhizobium sp.]MDP3077047.1 PASTA domain-containing protein [Bradyrhizobium sp.]